MKKDAKLTTLRHRTTVRSHYQATIIPNNDIQISLLPDLSGYFPVLTFKPAKIKAAANIIVCRLENLSNEKLLWEEIMKIKAMPVNMSQKKELKVNLLVRRFILFSFNLSLINIVQNNS